MNKGERSEYSGALGAARAEIEKLLSKRAAIDKRLLQLKDTIDSLGFLLKSPPEGMQSDADQDTILEGVGISDAIRIVLKEAQIPLTPGELKAFLSSRRFDFSGYANPMAVVHNTLKRLALQGEVATFQRNSGVLYAHADERAKK